MKILELFSGIGGFTKGFQQAGFEITDHFFSEIDKYAIANYKYNFPNAKYIGDAKLIQPTTIGEVDIVTGGFPCQSFSSAGKRQGFEDARGTLFFEIVRICKDLRPKYILLENVKNLLNHDGGRTFAIIYQSLADIGYSVEFQLVNTKWFLPQNRERIYIVGHLTPTGGEFRGVFPIGETGELYKSGETKIVCDYSRTLTARYYASSAMGSFIKHYDGPIQSNKSNIRRLTEIECERLQGFPDNWTKFGDFNGMIKEISKSQRYKMIGNAVTVNVVEVIARKLKKLI